MSISRRELLASATGLAALSVGEPLMCSAQPASSGQPAIFKPPGKPILVASGNGRPAIKRALELLRQGADPVDAVVAGVNIVEDDPTDRSVGYGGIPNEDGVVELDACVMHGPTHKGGAVAALRNIRNPSSVAKLVMQRSDHVLLVGEGALRFAKAHGFREEDLLTDEARRIWLKWKETHCDDDGWLSPESEQQAVSRRLDPGPEFSHGTITCMAMTAGGDIGGCTSTSGLSFKIPGRVGDSPILGAGLYVDNAVGACGATGRGEASMLNCASFLVVELMRSGATPEEACRRALQRVADHTEKRLRDAEGRPAYGLTLYALRKDGLIGGASLRGDYQMAAFDGDEFRDVVLPGLFPEMPKKQS